MNRHILSSHIKVAVMFGIAISTSYENAFASAPHACKTQQNDVLTNFSRFLGTSTDIRYKRCKQDEMKSAFILKLDDEYSSGTDDVEFRGKYSTLVEHHKGMDLFITGESVRTQLVTPTTRSKSSGPNLETLNGYQSLTNQPSD